MPQRLAPLGEDVLERIVLPDDAGQLRQRVGLLPRTGRLAGSAKLALEIFEIERETVSSWLTHGMIHPSAGHPHARIGFPMRLAVVLTCAR